MAGLVPAIHEFVIAGLDPAIHSADASTLPRPKGMDARIKSGHDEVV
jgi:hypothetical protein